MKTYTSQRKVTGIHRVELLVAHVVASYPALRVKFRLAAGGLAPLLVLLHQGSII